ncbi:MAG TPA: anti-sigma factor [Pseudonocardia sp.]
MTSPDIHTLGGAYALDAVDDLERAAFDRHLAECESCAAEVAEYRETASRLAEGAWSVPPPRMREQVLARAAATPQLPPVGSRRNGASPVTRWRRLAVAAAVVGVLGVGTAVTTYAVQEQRLADERVAVAAADQQADRIRAVLAAPDAALRAGQLTGGGRVTVVVSDAQDAGVVVLADAPPPGPDRAYQLWVVDDMTPVSVGLLPAGRSQATTLIQGVRGRAAFAVSVEPATGSPQPTTTPLVGIPLV